MSHLLAVDAGGTRTRAVWLNSKTLIWARGEAGPGRHVEGEEAHLVETLDEAVRRAWSGHAENPSKDVDYPPQTLSLRIAGAGVSTTEESRRLEEALRRTAFFRNLGEPPLTVESDLAAAWRGAHAGEDGIVLVAGTGSVAFGRHRAPGEDLEARAGGHGSVLSDEGSAYDLVRRAVGAALRSDDGRDPSTVLGARLDRYFERNRRELVLAIEHRRLDRHEIAGFAPEVLEAAHSRDAVARALVEDGAEALSDMAIAVGRRLELPSLPVAFAGGVLAGSAFYRDLVAASLRRRSAHRVTDARFSPLAGALLGDLAAPSLRLAPRTKTVLEQIS